MDDHFLTINKPTNFLLKEKSSKFFSYAFSVNSTEEVEVQLKALKKEHLKSRHICYAYIIGVDKNNFRANDDGEPSGTAGRPIIGQIEKLNLTNTLVAVVRYFGGTKLGTSGLIKAYKESAAQALAKAEVIEVLLTKQIKLICNYDSVGEVREILSRLAYQMVNIEYAEKVSLTFEVRLSEVNNSIKQIKSKLLKRSIEDINDDTKVQGLAFEICEKA